MFGKSFNQIGNAITNKLIDFNDEFERTGKLADSWKNTDSIWKRLYGNKSDADWIKNSAGEIVTGANIDTFMSKMDDTGYSSLLQNLIDIDAQVKSGTTTWQDYFSNLKDNQKWLIDFVQNTDLQKASLDDVKKAYEAARQGAIDHNKELESMTLSAKAGQVALKGLAIAGNMIAMWAIGEAVSLVVKGIQNLANAQENAIEKANEFISKFEEQRDTLASNKKNIDSISSDYEKLAKGIDSLGRNVSLSTEEYSQYNDIVNQIADMFPQMVKGYTEEGNAIIAHKGNVEELTKAYEEQKKAAQDAIIVGSADVFKGFKSKLNHNREWRWEESGLLQMRKFGQDLLQRIDNGEFDYREDNNNNNLIFHEFLNYAGVKIDRINVPTSEYNSEIEKQRIKIVSAIDSLTREINAETAKIRPIMKAYLEQSFEFQGLDNKAQDVVKQIVGQFDSEFYAQFDNETEMASWITENIVNRFKGKDGENMSIEFGTIFDLQTQFNADKIPVSEYKEKLSAFLTLIGSLPDETQKAIKLLFGIQTNDDGTTTSDVDTMVENVKKKLQDDSDDKVGELSLGDLKIAADLTIDSEETKKNVESELSNLEQGGSVNLLLRPQIDTSELNAKGWDAGEGTATVFSSTYSNEDGTVAINFTPIIADPNLAYSSVI